MMLQIHVKNRTRPSYRRRCFQTSSIVSCNKSTASCSSPARKNAWRCNFDESISNILPNACASPSRATRTSPPISSSEISGSPSNSFTSRSTSHQTVNLPCRAGIFPIQPKKFARLFQKNHYFIKVAEFLLRFQLKPAVLAFQLHSAKFKRPANQRVLDRFQRPQPAALVSRCGAQHLQPHCDRELFATHISKHPEELPNERVRGFCHTAEKCRPLCFVFRIRQVHNACRLLIPAGHFVHQLKQLV